MYVCDLVEIRKKCFFSQQIIKYSNFHIPPPPPLPKREVRGIAFMIHVDSPSMNLVSAKTPNYFINFNEISHQRSYLKCLAGKRLWFS
jgi:hypothetical protein